MDEELTVRLEALEFMVCRAYSMVMLSANLSEQEISDLEYQGLLNMDRQANEIGDHEGFDRERSEQLASLPNAILALQIEARKMREAVRKPSS